MGWQDIAKSVYSRIALGLAAMAALSNAGNANWTGQFDAPKAATLGLALIAWVAAEIFSEKENAYKPSAHDLALYERFKNSFSQSDISFLQNHDFSASFDRSNTSNVHRFNSEWNGAAFEFENKKLNSCLVSFKEAAKEFGSYVAYHSGPHEILANVQVVAVYDETGEISPESQVEINTLNSLGAKLHGAFDNMNRAAINVGMVSVPN